MRASDEIPPYPHAPPGVDRLSDPDTVRFARRYWLAVARAAGLRGDNHSAVVAAALADTFGRAAVEPIGGRDNAGPLATRTRGQGAGLKP